VVFVANIYRALAVILELVSGLLTIYKYILIAACVLSWVNPDPYNPIVNFIYRVTEPLLQRIRRYTPNTGALDISPIVAFVLIYVIQIVILDTAIYYLRAAAFGGATGMNLRGF
jgi:YggT family protein